jgi:hypothetical protein
LRTLANRAFTEKHNCSKITLKIHKSEEQEGIEKQVQFIKNSVPKGILLCFNYNDQVGVLGYLPAKHQSQTHLPLDKVARTRRLCVRSTLGLEDLDTNNVGVGVELELLLLGGSLSWVWCVEDVIKLLKL